MGKGRLEYIQQNAGRLSLFRKNIFPFSYVEPFGYDISANVKCHRQISSEIWGNFPISPKLRGTRRRIQSRGIKITPHPQLFVTYPRAGSEIKGIGKERNTETSNGGKTLVLNTANNK